jgi:Zn-dependent protease with chaperone function
MSADVSADATPDRTRKTFPGISSRAYEHPADRTALVALRKADGFSSLFKKFNGLLKEPQVRLALLADSVKVSDQQFSRLDRLLTDACAALDMPYRPGFFVQQDPRTNAVCIGLDQPTIVLSTGLIEILDEEELRFVIGHETGHALSGHAVYRTMLMWLTLMADNLSWLPGGSFGIGVIITMLQEWFRKSELSCDRAGLLVGQDLEAGMRSLMKMAGGAHLEEMNPLAFLDQAREYESGGTIKDSFLKLMLVKDRSHPITSLRALELTRWVEGGDYRRILAGDYPRREDDRDASFREEAKSAGDSYVNTVKNSTDPLFTKLRSFADDASGVGERLGQKMYRMWGPQGPGNGNSDSSSASGNAGDSAGNDDYEQDEETP